MGGRAYGQDWEYRGELVGRHGRTAESMLKFVLTRFDIHGASSSASSHFCG
jgi:hypothetical protein